jgi:chorismate synthase
LNTFGHVLRLTSFGESHGTAIGGVLDGFPPGVRINEDVLRKEMARRKPGQSSITTDRNEADSVEFISGIFEGVSTGAPIAFTIKNKDVKSGDYDSLRHVFRPSHADYTYTQKYGIRDHRGGGRSSARETAIRVVAGALAKMVLLEKGIQIIGYVSQVGHIICPKNEIDLDMSSIESNAVRCPHTATALEMETYISRLKDEGNSIGGTVSGIIKGCPVGLGAPVYAKLHADLGAAMLGINAVKGFDYGSGFDDLAKTGQELNDAFDAVDQQISTKTNHSGGIQGGISNGNDIYFRVAFKPVATIKIEQPSVTDGGENITFKPDGRHDPCVLPRAVPIVEAMAALVILDHLLLAKTLHV